MRRQPHSNACCYDYFASTLGLVPSMGEECLEGITVVIDESCQRRDGVVLAQSPERHEAHARVFKAYDAELVALHLSRDLQKHPALYVDRLLVEACPPPAVLRRSDLLD